VPNIAQTAICGSWHIGQEMADEMLLASTRVRPQRLLESGFHFAHPDLAGAFRAVFEAK
jgi:NAD dependent epimerase/dehydratase family enzyme